MEIILDKKNNNEGLIKIKLNESDYQTKVQEKIKEYSKKANIKGFRPGKVPTSLINKLYGKSIKADEINHVLQDSLKGYLSENNIKLIGDPIPDLEKSKTIDWDNDSEMEFDYSVGLLEDFQYDISKKVKEKKYIIEVQDKTIDETLEDVKKQYGQMTNPEVSEEGDTLYGLFQMDGMEEDTDGTLDLKYVDKKEKKKLIGLKKDDEFEIDLKNINDPLGIAQMLKTTIDEAKEKKGKVKAKVKNVNRIVDAELNQDLFDKVFGKDNVKSEDEFIKKVKETIEENYNRESDYKLELDIRDHLIEKTKINLPDDFLKRWLLFSNEGKVTEEQIEKDYDKFVNDLKWTLISNKVMEDHEIKVEANEVVDKARELIVQQLGGASMVEAFQEQLDGIVDNYLKSENGQNYMNVYNQLRSEKLVDYIKDQITITDKKIKVDDFKKLAEAQ